MRRIYSMLLAMTMICIGFNFSACSNKKTDSTDGAKEASVTEQTKVDSKSGKKITIGVMPKLVGIDYFNAVEKGAKEAGSALGIEVVYDGPAEPASTRQAQILDTWIARKFDAICVAPNDPEAIAPTLQKARDRGIRVITYDADARIDSRDFFITQATDPAIAKGLMDLMAKNKGPDCKYLILTGSLTAANQNVWIAELEKYRATTYPNMVNLSPTAPLSSAEDSAQALITIRDAIKTYPDVQGIFALTSVALPGAAEALKKENAYDRIYLTGLSAPNTMKPFIEAGVLKEFILWSPVDLGYLVVEAAKAAVDGSLTKDSTQLQAGRLGDKPVNNGVVLLGDPIVFDAQNINEYDF